MKLSEINPNKLDNTLIKKLFFDVKNEDYDYADYMIIYGCHIKELLDERMNHALSIIKNKNIDKIVLTGGVGVNGNFNESEYMYNVLLKNGIDKNMIIIENKSTTTEENNINILNMLDLNSINKRTNIVLVTQKVHMFRLKLHWKNIIKNPNIHFYYDSIDESIISYNNCINDPMLQLEVKKQVEKTINFIKEGKYSDYDID